MKSGNIKYTGGELKKAAKKLLSRKKSLSAGDEVACEIVRDLIPLYADRAASDQTGKFVRAHIAGCRSCADYFRSVVTATREKRMSSRAGRIGVGGFAGIAGKIKRRRAIYASVTTVALLVLIGLNLYAFLTRGTDR